MKLLMRFNKNAVKKTPIQHQKISFFELNFNASNELIEEHAADEKMK